MFSPALHEKLVGSTVVMACPCAGNLGAMTVDCLLATISKRGQLVREGSGLSEYLIPVTGYDCFPEMSEPFLVMPVEGSIVTYLLLFIVTNCCPILVYSVAGASKLFILQIRSDCNPMHSEKLSSELAAVLASARIAHAILVSGFGEDDVLDEHQPFRYFLFFKLVVRSNIYNLFAHCSIGGFYARSTKAGEIAVQNTEFHELSAMLSSALHIELSSIGIFDADAAVETDNSNIAMCMMRRELQAESDLPLTVVGSCCRLNHRFNVSKENAFRLGASLGVLPTELKSIDAPASWEAVFSEEIM